MALACCSSTFVQKRFVASFFNRRTAADLWKSCTSVSKYGKKKGQKPRIRRRDLNRFRQVGVGPISVVYPGLTTPVSTQMDTTVAGLPRQIIRAPKMLPPDPEYQERFDQQRDSIDISFKRKFPERLDPLERGFTSTKMPGRRLGAPTYYDTEGKPVTIDGFESVCLDLRRKSTMTGKYGRVSWMVALAAAGNGQGMAGYAYKDKDDATQAVRSARDAAVKRLHHIKLLDNRTIYQDFYAECGGTRVFAFKMPENYGVVAHRVIQQICHLAGIKDIYVKLGGAVSNVHAMTHAFFIGLTNQETYQELAERKRLLVVEMDPHNQYVPKVIAAPTTSTVRTMDEVPDDEVLEVDKMYGQGRTPYKTPSVYEKSKREFWELAHKDPGSLKKRRDEHFMRNWDQVRRQLLQDNVVHRWTRIERQNWAKRYDAQVRAGLKPLPMGIGLSKVDREGEDTH